MHRSDVYSSGRAAELFLPATFKDYQELWRTHLRIELMAEELRRRLARSQIFKISDAFDICDMNRNGRVNEAELVMIFEERGLHVSARDSRLLF